MLGGTGEELRDWTDIRDVVRALEFTMRLASDPDAMTVVFNVGSGEATSVGRIAAMVLESGRRQRGLSSMARHGPVTLAAWWRMAGSCRKKVLPGAFP